MFSSRMSSILRSTPESFREERILHVRLRRGEDFAVDHHLALAQFVGSHGCIRAVQSPDLDLHWPDGHREQKHDGKRPVHLFDGVEFKKETNSSATESSLRIRSKRRVGPSSRSGSRSST